MLHPFGCPQTPPLLRWAQRAILSAVIACTGLAVAQAQKASPAAASGVDVTTYAYDNNRTGNNPQEIRLNPKLVNPYTFGKLFTLPVDGQVYAQPLYLSALTIPGKGAHNVVYVATEHDSIYAFDADTSGPPLWHVSFINPPSVTSVPNGDTGSDDINPEIGITGTPVIDRKAGTIYLVAKTKETGINGTAYVQRLHALDITTGAEKPNSPVVIQGSVPGNGDGNDGNGNLPFDPLRNAQRPGLLLLNGTVYIGWASHGDNGPYHGFIMGYNSTSLQQTAIWCVSPNAVTDPSGYPLSAGGIWQSGGGLAADTAGNIFFATGNGTFDVDPTSPTYPAYGDSIVKLSTAGGRLAVADYFTPFEQQDLNDTDEDLGSGGVVLLPDVAQFNGHTHLLVQAGKEGKLYVVDRDNLGHNNGLFDKLAQSVPNAVGGVWGKPAYYNHTVYFGGVGDALRAFTIRTVTSTSYYYYAFDKTSHIQYNGSAGLNGANIQLTNGKAGEAGSAFSTDRVNVSRFTTQFLFGSTGTAPTGNGFTFTLQSAGSGALGAMDTGLGYTGISGSVAIKWDQVLHNNWVLDLGGQASGTFTLTFGGQTTAPLNYNASASDIQAALNALSSININPLPPPITQGTATVTGNGPFTINVTDTLPAIAVTPTLSANFANLKTPANASLQVNASSTGIYLNGTQVIKPFIDLAIPGINLLSGDVFLVTITYSGTTLQVTTQDEASGAISIQAYTVNIPAVVGAPLAFAGFTGSTGGYNSTQDILAWIYQGPITAQRLIGQSDQSRTTFGFPGPTPTISSNGTGGSGINGILWAIQTDQYGNGGPAVLHAFDAANLSNEIYSSAILNDNPSGSAVKFAVPTVVNGKVYVGSSNGLNVYGTHRPIGGN